MKSFGPNIGASPVVRGGAAWGGEIIIGAMLVGAWTTGLTLLLAGDRVAVGAVTGMDCVVVGVTASIAGVFKAGSDVLPGCGAAGFAGTVA